MLANEEETTLMFTIGQSNRIMMVLFVLLMLQAVGHGQAQSQAQGARKFDEFGDIRYSDTIARLDNFAVQLQQETNARGFIIVYRSYRDLPGLSNRYALWMKNYMVGARGMPPERLVTVDGGIAPCLTQELWIVPPGATPNPKDDAYERPFIDSDVATKIDEHYSGEDWNEAGNGSYSDLAVNLDAFANYLRQHPRASGYIIAYSQHYIEHPVVTDERGRERTEWHELIDSPATARRTLNIEKRYLVKTYGIAPSRIKLVEGGYRNLRLVELWLVPPGARPPAPSPNQFGRRRPRR